MKNSRQEKIASLIKENIVSTQAELLNLLIKNGVKVTQATVSRDIKDMRLIKRTDENGVHRYCVPDVEENTRYTSIFSHSVLSADHAGNTVVLKCRTGTAQAACAGLDALEIPDIVGTLAGDDTIFILCRSEKAAEDIEYQLQSAIDG